MYYQNKVFGTSDDMPVWNFVVNSDVRGMFMASYNVEMIGILDFINVTSSTYTTKTNYYSPFYACTKLSALYIKNLKVSLRLSWSPINQDSLKYILTNAANTSTITLYISAYTYYNLTDENKNLAEKKNISLTLDSARNPEFKMWAESDNILTILNTVNGD